MQNNQVNNIFYNRAKAKKYLDTYWKNYNTAYPAFLGNGRDCANFISQMLHAGDMPFVDDGNPNHYTLARNWYCKPGATNRDGDKNISLTWKVAAAFGNHWIRRCERHLRDSVLNIENQFNEFASLVYIGDVVQFCYADGTPWHTLAVTDFFDDAEYHIKDIVLASHTIDSNRRSLYRTLLTYPNDYQLRYYMIKAGE